MKIAEENGSKPRTLTCTLWTRILSALARLLDWPRIHFEVHKLGSLIRVSRSPRHRSRLTPLQCSHRYQFLVIVPFRCLPFSVAIEERIDVRESEFVVFGKERVVLGILEALLKPVIAKPRGGMDQVPPLIGEVLHSPICHGNEQRSVWVQPRSPRNYVHCRSASLW